MLESAGTFREVFIWHECMLSHFSHVRLFATLCTLAHQASLSMGFSRQEHWSRLPCLLQGIFPNPEVEPTSLASPALAGKFFTLVPPGKPLYLACPSFISCGRERVRRRLGQESCLLADRVQRRSQGYTDRGDLMGKRLPDEPIVPDI